MRRADGNVPPPWVTAPGMASPVLPAESAPEQQDAGRSSRRAPSAHGATDSWAIDTCTPDARAPDSWPPDARSPDSWTPDARAPAGRDRAIRAPTPRESDARVSGRWPRRPAGARARRTDHRFPPGRFLGVVAAAVCAAAVGGALALPTSGPSPPSAAPIATTERSTAGEDPTAGGADVRRGAGTGADGSAEPATPSTDSAPADSAPADPATSDPATSDPATSDPAPTDPESTGSAPADSGPADPAAPAAGGGPTAGSDSTEPGGARVPGSGSTSADPSGSAARPSGSPATGSAGPGRDRPAPRTVLAVREVDRLGRVVVDADGFTLYRFDSDRDGAATCADACASTWPPVIVDPSLRMAVAGLATTDVGVVRRRDGTVQLTVGGWPMYRFAGDLRPGQDAGHGIGGVWFAVTSTGAKASAR